MKIKDLREKSIAELEKELEACQKEIFSLRLQQGIGQAPKPHLFKVARKSISTQMEVLKMHLEYTQCDIRYLGRNLQTP